MLEHSTEAEVCLRNRRGQGKSDHGTHTPALPASWPGLHAPHPSQSFPRIIKGPTFWILFIEWETEAQRS